MRTILNKLNKSDILHLLNEADVVHMKQYAFSAKFNKQDMIDKLMVVIRHECYITKHELPRR